MSNKENNNENKNEPVVGTENVIDDEELSKLEEFTVDNEKILLPLYDIKLQEKLDQKMGDGVDAFYSNEYEKAKEIFGRFKSDPLHMLGYGALDFMIALITFDKEKIAESLKTLESIERKASKQIDRINADEKKAGNSSSFMSKIHKKKEKKIINAKLRATIIKAECNLLSAALLLFQENMVSFVKAALNLKKVWSAYYSCWNEIKDNLEESKKVMDKHTYNGILFGIGSSKLLLSILPPKILSIISIFGFVGDREQGMNLLNQCINERNLYTPMALSAQLFYYSIFNSLTPASVSHETEIGEQLVNKGLEMYPNSAIQLYFKGRFIRLIHDLEASTEAFFLGNDAQNYYVELNHLLQYELILNCVFTHEWDRGIELLDKLIESKYYSEIFFSYLAGVISCMKNDIEKAKEYFQQSEELFKKNQGKMIDIEQYCINIIQRIKDDNYTDAEIAILEFMYLWDGIPCMDKKTLEMALDLKKDDEAEQDNENGNIKAVSKESVKSTSSSINYSSKKAIEKEYIYRLVKGSIYRELERYDESIKTLESIVESKHLFPKKSFIVPFANFELGALYTNTKEFAKAQRYFSKIKTHGIFMEFRLDLKLQKANEYLKYLMDKEKENSSSNQNLVKENSKQSVNKSSENVQEVSKDENQI